MRRSHWTPLIVPNSSDHSVYLVLDDLGRSGQIRPETDCETTDRETVIADLLAGQFPDPVRVVAFNTVES